MIKTIIFDFGDVFLNLDKAATQQKLREFNISVSEEILEHNKTYEKGLLSSRDFIDGYLSSFSGLTEITFTDSWNAILIDFPKHRLDFIKKLSEEKKYKLILLSNTNDIHIEWVKQNIVFFEEFKDYFDAFYLSHELNMRKPEPIIYKYVLQDHRLEPEETLFIDDTKENSDAAAALGFQTWNIDPDREDVVDLFAIKKELF